LKLWQEMIVNKQIKYEEVILFYDSIETVCLCRSLGMNSKWIKSPGDLIEGLKIIESR